MVQSFDQMLLYHHSMTPQSPLPPRERILQAALRLLEAGGLDAVSTRAVSAAAQVQAPTIYRQFGDMEGLMNAVIRAGFAAYHQVHAGQNIGIDPIADLREGWRLHLEFGLNHPHLYTLMYGTPRPGADSPAALEADVYLRTLLQSVAESGRLAVSVERAADLIRAGGEGATLRMLSTQASDSGLSDMMREAVLSAILKPEPGSEGGSVARKAAVHAASLGALMQDLPAVFSDAELALLVEWLRRLT